MGSFLFGNKKLLTETIPIKRGHLTTKRWLLFVLTFVFLNLQALPVQGADAWPTTRFKVFAGNPYIGDLVGTQDPTSPDGPNWPEFEDRIDRPHADAIREIERAFTEAAQWYENKGFPAPELEPLKRDESGLYYQVYLCQQELDHSLWEDFWGPNFSITALPYSRCGYDPIGGRTNAGAYSPACGSGDSRSRFIFINSDKALNASNELKEVGYQTIAHELMHAIIANTPFGRAEGSCSINYWIREGIPDAISYDLAEDIWQSRYVPDNSDRSLVKRYGYRPYSVLLPESRKAAGAPGTTIRYDFKYTASSFWRYIADSHPNGWGVLLTRKSGGAPGLLDLAVPRDVPSNSSREEWHSEVVWLNTGLQGKFGSNLAAVYSLFVNNFAFRIPPMKSYRDKPVEDTLPKWVKNVFGDCENVNLGIHNIAATQAITLQLQRLATACIWVEAPGVPGFVHISFQAKSEDLNLLKDITIGQPETEIMVRATPIGSAPVPQSGYLASWLGFPQMGTKRTLYLVSNAAALPQNTQPRTITLSVSRSTNTNTALATVPLPPSRVAKRPRKPSYHKHARSLAQRKRAIAKMVQEQMQLDKKALNPNVNGSTKIVRRANQPDCREPFKYNVCGPHLNIFLTLMPGTVIPLGASNAQGGIAAQTFGALQAMAATSLNSNADFQQWRARLDAIDGSLVNITIPLIDYGFTGTFSNADISVDMSGGRTWRALGPPDAQGRSRLRGRVTIQEYSPFVIRGNFNAPLAEFLSSGYTQRDTVSGTFSSVAPWLADERVSLLTESHEQMADDIANTLGIPAGIIYSMKQKGTIPGGTTTGLGTAAGGTIGTPECTCACSMKPFADELCELLCETEFAECTGP